MASCVEKWATLLAKRPLAFYFFFLFLSFLMSFIGFNVGGPVGIAPQGLYDWSVNGHKLTIDNDAYRDATGKVDEIGGQQVDPRTKSNPNEMFMILYMNKDKGDAEILTPSKLKQMCEVEKLFVETTKYSEFCKLKPVVDGETPECVPSGKQMQGAHFSIANYFYDQCVGPACFISAGHDYSCPLLEESYVDARRKEIYDNLKTEAGKIQFGMHVASDTMEHSPYKSDRTRSLMNLGGPLEGYNSMSEDATVQRLEYNKFYTELEPEMLEHFNLPSTSDPQHPSPYLLPAQTDDLHVIFWSFNMFQMEGNRLSNKDLSIVMLSVFFVFFWILMHTSSMWIACLGMSQILLSIPVTMFFYRPFIPYFGFMNVLAIFLVLGIGADDIFVFVDAWKQSATDVTEEYSTVQEFLQARARFALKRSASAIFNTSFTTALAFYVTATAPMMPLSAFGIFSGTAIVINYLMTLTYLPAFVIMWSRGGFEKVDTLCAPYCPPCCKGNFIPNCCTHCFKCAWWSPCTGKTAKDAAKAETDGEETGTQSDPTSVFLTKMYLPALKFTIGQSGIRPVPIFIVVAMLVTSIQGIIFATQLEPPVESERWYPDTHMFQEFQDTVETFLAASDDDLIKMRAVFGINSIDRSKFVYWKPDENRGAVIFEDKFDMSETGAQTAFLQACDDLRNWECKQDGCSGGFERLVKPGEGRFVCWLEEFDKWLQIIYPSTLRTGMDSSTFLQKVKEFRDPQAMTHPEAPFGNWKETIGIVDGELKYCTIDFTSTVENQPSLRVMAGVLENVKEYLDKVAGYTPDSLGDPSIIALGPEFVWYPAMRAILANLFQGFFVCFPIVLVVLVLATHNVITGVVATLCVASIVACTLGFCKSAMGWYIGIGESVAGVMVIGFSVDYVVHMAHMYSEAEQKGFVSRIDKVEYALTNMGGTVVAGAVTTFGAGVFMFFCVVTFFGKIATILCVTVMYSFLFSVGMLMSFLSLAGPEGSCGELSFLTSKTATTSSTTVDTLTPQ